MAKITPAPLTRTLAEVAREITADYASKGQPVHWSAVPYVEAMSMMDTADLGAPYFEDHGDDLVIYALSNLSTWRGPVATRVRAELKAALADYQTRAHQRS